MDGFKSGLESQDLFTFEVYKECVRQNRAFNSGNVEAEVRSLYLEAMNGFL